MWFTLLRLQTCGPRENFPPPWVEGEAPEPALAKVDSRRGGNDAPLPDDFLHLADVDNSFQEAAVVLKQDMVKALATICRCDGARLASKLRSQRKVSKDLARLVDNASMDIVTTDRPSHIGLGGARGAAMVKVVGLMASSARGMDES